MFSSSSLASLETLDQLFISNLKWLNGIWSDLTTTSRQQFENPVFRSDALEDKLNLKSSCMYKYRYYHATSVIRAMFLPVGNCIGKQMLKFIFLLFNKDRWILRIISRMLRNHRGTKYFEKLIDIPFWQPYEASRTPWEEQCFLSVLSGNFQGKIEINLQCFGASIARNTSPMNSGTQWARRYPSVIFCSFRCDTQRLKDKINFTSCFKWISNS